MRRLAVTLAVAIAAASPPAAGARVAVGAAGARSRVAAPAPAGASGARSRGTARTPGGKSGARSRGTARTPPGATGATGAAPQVTARAPAGASGATATPRQTLTPSSGMLAPVSDPLAANGFTSPSCTTAQLFVQLDPAAQRDCDVSGVAVAPVPLSNYGVDTNIPSTLEATVDEDLDSVVQSLIVTPVWTALVWLVHVVIVALEWCFSIDLLAPAMMGAIASALSGAEGIFTEPWLGLALSLAGIAFAWNGLVRRRVADTLGQAALMLAMMAVGLWVIADPSGTVGAVSRLADQAALGTVSATATGSASQPTGGLDDALGEVFDSAITAPWCFLEFGDVNWCRDPSRLDPRLVAVAGQVERLYAAAAYCRSAPGIEPCAKSRAQQHSDESIALALSAARTNGAIFLAAPVGSTARNDLSSQTSIPTLYGTLCGSTDPTACTADTAPQAEFRTAQGTWPRVGGLLLITIGTVGMLLLYGFIALRLLGAALALLIYLMLAPLAVLAPAFGESGRGTFRVWLIRLVGAALSKLVYSVMLGVTLLIAHLLTSLETLGWWTQWLLISVFWWLAYEHRHRMLSFVIHEREEPRSRLALAQRLRYQAQAYGATRRGVARAARSGRARVAGAFEAMKKIREYGGDAASRLPPARSRPRPGGANGALAAQVERSLASERVPRQQVPLLREQIARLQTRRELLRREERGARRSGSPRRAGSLAMRARTVEAELVERRAQLRSAGGGRLARYAATRARAKALNDTALSQRPRRERDYVRLAGLANLAPGAYRRAPEPERRAARLEIERQLAHRRELLIESGRVRAADVSRPHAAPNERRERQFAPRLQ
jgi:hypothetical protein